MRATTDNITSWQSEQMTGPTRRPARNLASSWARGRRQLTPWAYSHIRAIAAVRLTVSAFLVVLGALLISHSHDALAALPFAGAVVNFSIGCLDMTVVRAAPPRT